MTFTVDLPMPPSSNALFTTGGFGKRGRGLSKAYRDWRDSAGLILNAAWVQAGRPMIEGPWGLDIRLNLDRRSDTTNRIKALEDLLVKAKIVPDDCWMDAAWIVRDRTVGEARVRVFALD